VDRSEPTGHPQRGPGHIWRFAGCEFDERRRELRVQGTLVDIEVKPLEVLHQLLINAGEVVTKAELLESVWPGVSVVDGSLATAISKVRKVLSDDRLVVTIPRVGYKLAVPVHCTRVSGPVGPDLHLEPGQRVPGRDQWRLVRRLDQSPASDVWLAEHHKTREPRVFKFASDGVRLKSLKREVTVARLLREALGERPEFVRLLEWNFDTPPWFLESEYGGPNLAEWAEAQGGLENVPWHVRVKLLMDVARAVAAAHALDVLHKDLKPGNILIAPAPDGTPQIKIADFGSASLLTPARLGALGITNLGFTQGASRENDSLTGTVMYLAPEVLAGELPTAASDVFALGVLLYQLVVADFKWPIAPGWESGVSDPLLREDIAEAACGEPARRLTSAAELADRLMNLDRRRRDREEAHQRQQEAREQTGAGMRGRWLAIAGAALLAVAAALSLSRGPSPPPPLKTVGVLPFQNAGSDASLDFLRLALADEVSTILSTVHGLAVRPLATTMEHDGPGVDIRQTGRAIGATTVVTGHFVRAGDQLQVTLEAVDAETNQVLWRDTVDAPMRSLIATQVQLALKVSRGLAQALGSSSTDLGPQPSDEEAYDLFLRSAALTFDPGPNPSGIRMLEKAVELDPRYPPAWLALGRRYYVESRYSTGNPSMMQRYDAALERAVTLDPGYIPAVAGLIVSRVERGDLVNAHARAVELVRRRPDSVDAQFVLSYVLRFAGLLEESARHCETAFLLDPQTQTAGLRSCAIVSFLLDDYPRAMNYLHLDRGSDWAKALTVHMLVRQGKEQEALQIGPPRIPQWGSYDLLLACVERRFPAEIAAQAATLRPSGDPEANYLAGSHLAYCGQIGAALSMVRTAIDRNYCSYPAMETDPFFATLRATPEYADLRAAGLACHNGLLAARGRNPS
jgi:DNA-binding winged helix-turn-helix (wHTH) protein/serine/threonine protein kinase